MATNWPLLRVHYRDPDEGWEGVLVVDSLVDGRAAGGVRVTRTVDADEVARLARAMTLKNRAMGLPIGGAKVGLRYDPNCPRKVDALTRLFQHIKPICMEMYGFGPDMNTSPAGLDEVAKRIGMRSRHHALVGKDEGRWANIDRYHEVLSRPYGPLTVNDCRTGIGVCQSVIRGARSLGLGTPLKIAVQGFGQVGGSAAWLLKRAGHTIVGVSDSGGYYESDHGLDIDALIAARGKDGVIDATKLSGLEQKPRDNVISRDCDVLVLAAVRDVVTKDNVHTVKGKLVVEGGNLAVTDAATSMLHGRGVMVIPDFIASGGAISVVAGVICLGWDTSDTESFMQHIGEHVGQAVDRAIAAAKEHSLPVRQAAILALDVEMETKL